jgi:tetratricopeptide (TPR) repeat protein
MPVSLLYLAQLEREQGNLGAAVEALRMAVALDPDDTTAVALLGACLTQAGRADQAAELLRPYAQGEAPDLDVLTTRSLALARLGRFPDAFTTLARAREIDPSSAMALLTTGTVHLMNDDRRRAREAFEAAVAQNPGAARGWSSLAFVAAQEGRADEALGHWRKAIALDPAESEKLFAFSAMLWRAGRRAEARPYLECFVAAAPQAAHPRELQQARDWLLTLPPRG